MRSHDRAGFPLLLGNAAEQIINADNATLTTAPGFRVDTLDATALTITGFGTLSYIDQNESDLEAADTAPLYVLLRGGTARYSRNPR